MKTIIAILILSAFILASGSGSWAISWEDNLESALKEARSAGKPVMADFYTGWCGWCKKLDRDVYTDADVNRVAEKFICVKVNCEIDKEAFSKYGLRGYPTIIFFDPAGNIEETVVGYRTAQVFTGIMNKVLDKTPRSNVATERPAVKEEPVIKEKRAAGEFNLAGIMVSKAIVNDKVVVVGDEIDDAKVIAITADHVRLRYKGKDLTLKME